MSVILFSVLWIVFLMGILGLIVYINVNLKSKFKFSTRIFISTLLGLILGIIFQNTLNIVGMENTEIALKNVTSAVSLIGRGFTSLLRMIVVPLIGISIYNSIVNSKSGENFKKLSIKSVTYYTFIVVLAAVIGVCVSLMFGLGKGMTLPEGIESWKGKGEYKGVIDSIISFIPSNVFKAMAETSIAGVVIFSSFLGFGTNRVEIKNPEIVKPLKDISKALFSVMTSITITIIKILPYGVAALMFNLAASYGIEVFKNLFVYFIVMVISMIGVFIIQAANLVLHHINPILYYKKALPPLLLAFTSSSSLGTLPLTIETLKNEIGVSEGTADFTPALGTTIGLSTCAGVFPSVLAIMIANMNNIEITPLFLITLFILIILGSFGMAGIPGTAYIAATVVLGGLGLPFDPVALVLPIDPIVDMGRTMINVNGAMTVTTVVDKELGTFKSKL